MGFIGNKISHIAHRIGNKVASARKVGLKVSHAIHSGLHIAGNIADKVDKIANKVKKGAEKMSGIPIIGSVAGLVAAGAHQTQNLAHLGKKGVRGLEKKVGKVEKSISKYSKHAARKFRDGTTLAIKTSNKAESKYHDTVQKAKSKMKVGRHRIKSAKESIHSEVNDVRNNAKKLFS